MRQLLRAVCILSVIAGAWLAVMELVLRRGTYLNGLLVALCIVAQAAVTLLLVRPGRVRASLRLLVVLGAAAVGFLGFSAVLRILHAPHFEGYVLVIGSALVLQALLTFAVVGGELFGGRGLRHA